MATTHVTSLHRRIIFTIPSFFFYIIRTKDVSLSIPVVGGTSCKPITELRSTFIEKYIYVGFEYNVKHIKLIHST